MPNKEGTVIDPPNDERDEEPDHYMCNIPNDDDVGGEELVWFAAPEDMAFASIGGAPVKDAYCAANASTVGKANVFERSYAAGAVHASRRAVREEEDARRQVDKSRTVERRTAARGGGGGSSKPVHERLRPSKEDQQRAVEERCVLCCCRDCPAHTPLPPPSPPANALSASTSGALTSGPVVTPSRGARAGRRDRHRPHGAAQDRVRGAPRCDARKGESARPERLVRARAAGRARRPQRRVALKLGTQRFFRR